MIRTRSTAIWGEDHDPVVGKQALVMVPYPLVMGLAEKLQYPALAVLSELCWQAHLTKRRSFIYSSDRLSKGVKRRGLLLLEKERWITVERPCGKSPKVSLR